MGPPIFLLNNSISFGHRLEYDMLLSRYKILLLWFCPEYTSSLAIQLNFFIHTRVPYKAGKQEYPFSTQLFLQLLSSKSAIRLQICWQQLSRLPIIQMPSPPSMHLGIPVQFFFFQIIFSTGACNIHHSYLWGRERTLKLKEA